jgi:hypothetical protein
MKRLIPLFLISQAAFGAFSFVAGVGAGSTAGNSITTGATWNASGATCLIAIVVSLTSASAPTISDSQSNNYGTAIFSVADAAVQTMRVFKVSAPSAANSMTLTATCTACFPSVIGIALAGITNCAMDTHNNGVSQSTQVPNSGNITLSSSPEEMWISGVSSNGATTHTPSAGTAAGPDIAQVGGQHFDLAASYAVGISGSGKNEGWTLNAVQPNAFAFILSMQDGPSTFISHRVSQ